MGTRDEGPAKAALTRVARGAVLVPLLLAVWAAPALADAYPAGSQQPPQVLGETFFRSPPAAAAAGPGAGAGGVSVGSVAFTGFDVLLFLAIAIVAVTLGLLLRRAGNRPAAR
jgi:hypothetical protein